MATRLQEERIGEALRDLEKGGGIATSRQVWRWISKRYPRRPGFASQKSVEQILRQIRAKTGPLEETRRTRRI